MLVHVNGRPSMIIRWEELHVGVQVAVSFVASSIVLTFVHWGFLNQPGGGGVFRMASSGVRSPRW